MNKLFLYFITTLFLLTACKGKVKDKLEETDQSNNPSLVATTKKPKPKDFEAAEFAFLKALQSEDFETINTYIHPEKGYYFVLSTEGIYHDCIHYNNIDSLFQYAKTASEHESNPFKYFLDVLVNLNDEQLEIVEKDLLGEETCEFAEEGTFLDTEEPDVKVLTDIYTTNAERDEEKLNPEKLIKLAEAQKEITHTIWIGSGEEADLLHFTQIDGEWFISIVDLRECG